LGRDADICNGKLAIRAATPSVLKSHERQKALMLRKVEAAGEIV